MKHFMWLIFVAVSIMIFVMPSSNCQPTTTFPPQTSDSTIVESITLESTILESTTVEATTIESTSDELTIAESDTDKSITVESDTDGSTPVETTTSGFLSTIWYSYIVQVPPRVKCAENQQQDRNGNCTYVYTKVIILYLSKVKTSLYSKIKIFCSEINLYVM